jgi:hypothetical protein
LNQFFNPSRPPAATVAEIRPPSPVPAVEADDQNAMDFVQTSDKGVPASKFQNEEADRQIQQERINLVARI